MREDTRRSIQNCIVYGFVVGPLLATAQVVTYLAFGLNAERPLRLAASLVEGPGIFTAADGASATFVAFCAYLLIAAFWGAVYGALSARAPTAVRRGYAEQASLGLFFGAFVWFVGFRVLGPLVAPWITSEPALPQLLLHMLAFGLPIGLLFARAERRTPVEDDLLERRLPAR
jgi:hypothetical protein